LHYLVDQKARKGAELRRVNSSSPITLSTSESSQLKTKPLPRPKLMKPWRPLFFLRAPVFAWVAWTIAVGTASLYLTIVVLPLVLAEKYQMNQLVIGLTFLPFGVSGMIGGLVGGRLANAMQTRFGVKESQLVTFIGGLGVVVPAILLFGWTQDYGAAAPIVFASLAGFGVSGCFGGMLSYATQFQPDNAAAITSVLQLLQFGLSCIAIVVGTSLVESVGTGPLFTFMSGLLLLSLIPGIVYVVFTLRAIHREQKRLKNDVAVSEMESSPTSTAANVSTEV